MQFEVIQFYPVSFCKFPPPINLYGRDRVQCLALNDQEAPAKSTGNLLPKQGEQMQGKMGVRE